jgi:hypothetical protein
MGLFTKLLILGSRKEADVQKKAKWSGVAAPAAPCCSSEYPMQVRYSHWQSHWLQLSFALGQCHWHSALITATRTESPLPLTVPQVDVISRRPSCCGKRSSDQNCNRESETIEAPSPAAVTSTSCNSNYESSDGAKSQTDLCKAPLHWQSPLQHASAVTTNQCLP